MQLKVFSRWWETKKETPVFVRVKPKRKKQKIQDNKTQRCVEDFVLGKQLCKLQKSLPCALPPPLKKIEALPAVYVKQKVKYEIPSSMYDWYITKTINGRLYTNILVRLPQVIQNLILNFSGIGEEIYQVGQEHHVICQFFHLDFFSHNILSKYKYNPLGPTTSLFYCSQLGLFEDRQQEVSTKRHITQIKKRKVRCAMDWFLHGTEEGHFVTSLLPNRFSWFLITLIVEYSDLYENKIEEHLELYERVKQLGYQKFHFDFHPLSHKDRRVPSGGECYFPDVGSFRSFPEFYQ